MLVLRRDATVHGSYSSGRVWQAHIEGAAIRATSFVWGLERSEDLHAPPPAEIGDEIRVTICSSPDEPLLLNFFSTRPARRISKFSAVSRHGWRTQRPYGNTWYVTLEPELSFPPGINFVGYADPREHVVTFSVDLGTNYMPIGIGRRVWVAADLMREA